MDSLKDIIKMLPNSVSGDGKVYASTIKKVLDFFGSYINDNVDEKLDQLGDGAAACVTGLRLTEQHATDSNGMPQNNILVEYDNTNVENFLHCQIWVKDSTNDVYAQHGTASGLRYIIEDVRAGETYTVKAVSVNKQGGTSAFADSPIAAITIAGSSLIPEPPRQFVLTWDEVGPLWEWLHDDNGYIDFFELRLDGNAGTYNENLLERTRNMWSRANPNVRSGTAYLFVRNIFGTYSQPAKLLFSKAVGAKPNKPALVNVLKGVQISMDALPEGFTHYTVVVNGEDYISHNSTFVYFQYSGQITVKYCFADDISNGEFSDEITADVQQLVRTEDIAENAIVADLIAANAITSAKIAANAITASKIDADAIHVGGANGNVTIEQGALVVGGDNGNVTIVDGAINGDMIQAGSIIGQHISAGAVNADKIAAGAITTDKIAAGAVSTEKIDISGGISSGARMSLLPNLIQIYDENGNIRIKLGIWSE